MQQSTYHLCAPMLYELGDLSMISGLFPEKRLWIERCWHRLVILKRCMSRLLISNRLDYDRKPTVIDVLTPGSLD